MGAQDGDDDFGLSSADEADLLQVETNFLKRKSDSELTEDPKRVKTASNNAVTTAKRVLKERFQMDAFRLKQEAAITCLLDGGSAVAIFPTGGGKSLCYQIPALCFKEMDRLGGVRQDYAEGGITLVVSPLIALMKDQVDALKRRGISAAVMDSTKSKEEHLQTVESMRNGTLDILYCAPERLNNEGFVSSMANVRGGVRLLAVDEAHCISEWGHAFRPDYLKVARFAKEIQAERVICLTATATPRVADDVCKAFDIPQDCLFRTTTYRPNLKLRAQSFITKMESYPQLRSLLTQFPGPTIIYVTLQRHTEELASQLKRSGFKAKPFHAGMATEDKMECQDAFMASDSLIIVATIAFGMGIDKANIRNVIHYDIPRSLEGYSQEIGRAGRDGGDSRCVLFLCAEDFHLRESFARGDLPSRQSVHALLTDIFSLSVSPPPDALIEVNLHHQSRAFDIKMTVLNNIYAQLELRFQLLRATTPKYTKYTYTLLRSLSQDPSSEARAVEGSSYKAKTLCHIDVEKASRASGISRAAIVSKLNDLNDRKMIDLNASGVINIYRVSSKWPPPIADRQRIIDDLYKDLQTREQQDLGRMDQVMDLITGESCFARKLAAHFGDSLPEGRLECGHCTWCEDKTAVKKVSRATVPLDEKRLKDLLAATPERDDPRFLARVAFGIGSPRVSQAKLSKHRVFGSMDDHNFADLLDAFTKVCD